MLIAEEPRCSVSDRKIRSRRVKPVSYISSTDHTYQTELSNPVNKLDPTGLSANDFMQYLDPDGGGGNPYYDPHAWAAYDPGESDPEKIRMKLAEAQQNRDAWLPYLSKLDFGDQSNFRSWDRDVQLWKDRLDQLYKDSCQNDYTPPKWEAPVVTTCQVVSLLAGAGGELVAGLRAAEAAEEALQAAQAAQALAKAAEVTRLQGIIDAEAATQQSLVALAEEQGFGAGHNIWTTIQTSIDKENKAIALLKALQGK